MNALTLTPGTALLDHTAMLAAVASRLSQLGVRVSVEWPGAVVITLAPDVCVWAGLNGWDYGTVNRLVGAAWQPDEDAVAEVDLTPEDATDPDHIAAAWAAFVARCARPRVLIRKDSGPDPERPWYYSVEHAPPREDALDYGNVETWPLAMDCAADVLAHPERY